MKPFSYSRCATRIVVCATEPQLAAGLLLQRRGHERRGRRAAVRLLLDRAHGEAATRSAVGQRAGGRLVELRRRRRPSRPSWPKSRPLATRGRRPRSAARRTAGPSLVARGSNVASMSQYAAERKAMRSRSRSTTSRVATDCTRPADSPGADLAPQHRARPRSRRAGRGCGGSPARRRGARRGRGSPRQRARIASRVISWKTIRLTGTLGFSTCIRCQAIASPSRSSSVASRSSSASLSARLSSLTFFFLSASTT